MNIGKEEAKLSLLIDYLENFLEVMKKYVYSQVAGYKVSLQKSIVFVCTSNEKMELGIKNIMLFTIEQKNEIVRSKPNKIL